jgi:Tectonin domain
MKNQSGKFLVQVLALALGIACTQSSPAQSFKKVRVAGSAPIVQVASGGVSVWALASNGNPYILKGKSFALANTISLSQIAVGGGNAAQPDEVWALNSSGSIYRASKSGTSWVFSPVAGSLDGIVVGPGYQDACHPYEVWGLNPSAQIYRYNYCSSGFDQVPGILCDIHVGGGEIWGADCGPDVFRFSFKTDAFVQVGSPFVAFPQLTVGSNGDVWAIDTGTSGVYKFDQLRGFQSEGGPFTQIQAGNGVWTLDGSNVNVYRFEPDANTFLHVSGPSLVSISVGSGGGVWGINSSHQVFAFSTP